MATSTVFGELQGNRHARSKFWTEFYDVGNPEAYQSSQRVFDSYFVHNQQMQTFNEQLILHVPLEAKEQIRC